MPTVVTELPLQTDPPRKRWTREEYEALSELSLSEQKLELVEGELINKMGKKRPHVLTVTLLRLWLDAAFGPLCVNSEAPIDVSPGDNPTNEPEPDLIVLSRQQSEFRHGNPGPADLLLVVEISETTLGFDLTTKARLYARASIQEYWVIDLNGRRIVVHRNPSDGRYGSVVGYAADEIVTPLAAPHSTLLVGDVIPA